MQKPSIPEGTRDFGPEQVRKRSYLFDTIRAVFVKFGFQPLETPAMENLSTLTGKYGEEGDKLLFKILNNGDYLAGAPTDLLEARDSEKLTKHLSKRGLRYDLTVPFQCDADVIGSDSLLYEAELAQIYDEAFANLGLPVVIKINNRKVLFGIAEAAGIADRFVEMTVAIDKLDKIGIEGVRKELAERGIAESAIATIEKILTANTLEALRPIFASSATGLNGLDELARVFHFLEKNPLKNELRFDITLARGLTYYTGCIFEVAAQNFQMGSIGGGGRYADLTGVFGVPGLSGVGISFGADRIYDVMEGLGLFPQTLAESVKMMLASFDDATFDYAFACATRLRAAGIAVEVYPEPGKLKKQFEYVAKRNIPFIAIAGESELQAGNLMVKNQKTGEQRAMALEEIIALLA
jgi:histidyl-tRNA synthetase